MHATRSLKELIAAWLELTKDQPPPLGLSVEEALRRAEDLRRRLREGDLPPLVDLDEDSKDVLFALVRLACDESDESRDERAAEAAGLYRFISRTRWEPDEFGQKDELLARCKEIAGQALGLETAKTTARVTPASQSAGQEAGRLFEDARAAIRLTLRSAYRMTETQADEAERSLLVWFKRFSQRPATPQNLRHALFAACSQLAPKLAPVEKELGSLLDHRSTGLFGSAQRNREEG